MPFFRKLPLFIFLNLLYFGYLFGQKENKVKWEEITVCEHDTLYLAMILVDSSLQEVVYQWQVQKNEEQNWTNLEGENKSYFVQFPFQQNFRYRCKAAFSDSCLLNADCEGIVTYFKPLSPPLPHINYDITPVTCSQNNGAISVKIEGDTRTFQYHWEHFGMKKQLQSLPSAWYHLQILDVWGCKRSDSAFVPIKSTQPTLHLQVNAAVCGQNNGEIHVLNPENQYFTYSWSTGALTQNIHHLSVGKYQLQVKNEFGCAKDTTITVSQVSPPLSIAVESEDANCGKSNGKITAKVYGKGQPYRYLWNTGDTVSSISHLAAGFYSFKITDNQGCTEESEVIEIKDKNLFKPRLKVKDVTCAEGNDGKIEVKIMGGDSLFLFSWSNGEISPSIENLAAGSYELSMQQKSTGCISKAKAEIKAPLAIEIQATDIPDSLTFALKINAKGGKAPYIFALNDSTNYQPFSIFDSLAIGDYRIFVQDANACTQQITYAIVAPPKLDESLPPVFISNIISPDGDGKHDEFVVKSPELRDAYIEIFNSQGDLIFEDLMSQSTWRGSANSAFCLPGIYYYFIQLNYENGLVRDIKGSVRLIR